jgi:hypothetical protein
MVYWLFQEGAIAMRDDYILRQERKIKKRLRALFSLKLLIYFAVSLLSFCFLLLLDPPPQMWGSEQITIMEMQWKDRPTFLSEYSDPGYTIADQNGNLYWIDEDINGLQVGETYSIRYTKGVFYRFFRSVSQEDFVIIDYEKSVAQWNQDVKLCCFMLLIFLLSFAKTVRLIKNMLSDKEIQQYRKNIQQHREKLHNR